MKERGGALLAVLWLSAALAAIAFSIALTVRGEISRVEASTEGLKAYYIALGGLERAELYMLWGSDDKLPDGRPRYWDPGYPAYPAQFPGGQALVEIIPESSKLDINSAKPEELFQLLLLLGVPSDQALQIASAIVDWRSQADGPTVFDAFYMGQVPSFRARHASLEEIEELLFVRGVTAELYYGHYNSAADGSMVEVPGLRDCVTAYRAEKQGYDVNTAAPAVLALAGLAPQVVEMIVSMRRVAPITQPQFEAMGEMLASAGGSVGLGGGPFYTIRSTGRAFGPNRQLLETRRTVTAVVRKNDPRWQMKEPWTVIRYRESDPAERLLFEIWPR